MRAFKVGLRDNVFRSLFYQATLPPTLIYIHVWIVPVLQTLDFYIPKFVQREGLIGDNPGLGFRPAGGLGFKTMDGEYKVSPSHV
jgi:hypothetical protein